MDFEWDEAEDLSSQRKHGLSVVVYTEPAEGVIRIIGARVANKREQALYRSQMDRIT